jgi:outer membrane receptor protein involved in Fe transport
VRTSRSPNETTGLTRAADSDSAGRFTIAGLPVSGTYTVSIRKDGFAAAQSPHVQLAPGSSAAVALTLKVAGETSVITVEGAASSLRFDQPQLGTSLAAEQMQQTPLLTRRITGLPLLNSANRPAINQGDIFMNEVLITTNGAGRRQAWFELDGANSVAMWGRQTIFTNIPLIAVEEMSVLTNAFTAAYGGGTGSVVNIVTRTGGNNYHGQLLELWRPAATKASLSGFTTTNAASGKDIASDTLGQTALAVSGPLLSQETHFFLAGEWNREAKASPITSTLAPGSFVGRYHGWLGLLQLDHQINDKNNAFLRINFDDFTDTNPNGIVGGASLANVARTFHRRTYSQNALLMNRQYELSETLSIASGRHQIAVGASVINAHNGGNSKEFGGPIFLGKFTYNTCTQAASICESSAYLNNINNIANYQQSFGNQNYTVDDQLFGIFAQDDYRTGPRLTLNLGLRYERQTFTNARLNFAPRIGFVYDIFGTGNIIFRAGYGIYQSQIVDNSFASYALGEPSGVFTYTATPGQFGFPASIAAAPLPQFPSGGVMPVRSLYVRPGQSTYLAQWFHTGALNWYPNALLNPYSQQWAASLEQRLAPSWTMTLDYVGAHTVRIIRPLDVDGPAPFIRTAQNQIRSAQAANCTRPYWIYWYAQHSMTCSSTTASNPQPPYSVIQTDVNDGYLHYHALEPQPRTQLFARLPDAGKLNVVPHSTMSIRILPARTLTTPTSPSIRSTDRPSTTSVTASC